jgi:hypothetical protein
MKKAALLFVFMAVSLVRAAVPGVPSTPSRSQLFPCVMTRYSTPLKLGWVLGLVRYYYTNHYCQHGPFVQIEPGFGGGKVNLGYRYGITGFLPIFNAGLSASLLQTWGNPLGDVEPGQTYAGIELSTAFSVLGLNAGVFRHVGGDDDEHDWITTLGVGAGF